MKLVAIIVTLTVLLVAGMIIWDLTASVRGEFAANLDVRQGRYEYLVAGLPPPWRRDRFAQLLEKRYGIKVRTAALCIVSKPLQSYVDAYDKVSMAAANYKFGRDVFQEAEEQARSEYEQTKPMQQASPPNE